MNQFEAKSYVYKSSYKCRTILQKSLEQEKKQQHTSHSLITLLSTATAIFGYYIIALCILSQSPSPDQHLFFMVYLLINILL